MFGAVPKLIWQKLHPADENNLCKWAMRCLLIELGNRKILIDTGMGNKQSEKFFSYFHPEQNEPLTEKLRSTGIHEEEITDVIITHLHFDHVGGAVSKSKDGQLYPTFPKARYYIHEKQLKWALNPNEREKASFLKENIEPLINSFEFVKKNSTIADCITFIKVDGHTEAQILPLISYGKQKILFAADLIPSVHHLPIHYIMAYDMCPKKTIAEKKDILQQALKENWILFLEHDQHNEACTLKKSEKGIQPDKMGDLKSLLN